MPRNPIIYRKSKPLTWLLAAALLLSALSFSGYTGRATYRTQATATEAVFLYRHKTSKVVCYNPLGTTAVSKPFNNNHQYYTSASLTCTRLVTLKLRHQLKQYYSFNTAHRLVLVNMIPKSSEADHIAVAIG